MTQRKGMLAAANQFTPMTNKNVQNAETPMCLLKMQDLATPKLNKNSLSPKEDQRFRSPAIQLQSPSTEVNVDTEVPSPKFSGIPETASLADVKSLLLAALNYVDNLQKLEDQRKSSLVTVATQTSESSSASRKKRNSSGEERVIPRSADRPENNEPQPRQIEKPKRRENSREQRYSDKQEQIKPILKKRPQKSSKDDQQDRLEQMNYDDGVNDIDIAVHNLSAARKKDASATKSSSEDLTEMKTTSMSKKSSLGSPNSSWSTDSEGRNLQQRMHQMSIILRNLEMQLDDISTKK